MKTFDRKSNFIRHLNRLSPCSSNISKTYEETKNKLKSYINKKYPKYSEEMISNILGDKLETETYRNYVCEYCNKSFKSKQYYKHHISVLCPRHLKFEQHIILDKVKKIERLKKDNSDLKEKIYYTLKTLPRYYIEEGKLINMEKNYISYYDLKNVLPYGSETIEHLDDKFMKKMIMNPEIGMANLIKAIHFNNDLNHNRNIFVKSRRFNLVEVYKKNGWKSVPRKEIFQNIIASKKDLMDEYFDKFRENNELKNKYIFKYETFSDCLDKYINYLAFSLNYDDRLKKAKLVYERICKMVNLIFLNNLKIEITYTPENNTNATDNFGIYNENFTEKIKSLIEKTEKEVEDLINDKKKNNNYKFDENCYEDIQEYINEIEPKKIKNLIEEEDNKDDMSVETDISSCFNNNSDKEISDDEEDFFADYQITEVDNIDENFFIKKKPKN